MLFKINNLNWQEIFSECNLGRIISIDRIQTIQPINHPIDTYGIHTNSVIIKSRDQANARINSYTFNTFGLSNAIINGKKLLKKDDEFMILSEFNKAKEITTAFIDIIVAVNGEESYLLEREYHEQGWYHTESQLEEMQALIKQIKKTPAPQEEKDIALKEIHEHIKKMQKAQEISNQILEHLELVHEITKRKIQKPISVRFQPIEKEYQS